MDLTELLDSEPLWIFFDSSGGHPWPVLGWTVFAAVVGYSYFNAKRQLPGDEPGDELGDEPSSHELRFRGDFAR